MIILILPKKNNVTINYEDNFISSLYFYKFTKTKDVVFGFTAINSQLAEQMNFKVGDELPLTLTEKKVVNTKTGEVFPNLFWAE